LSNNYVGKGIVPATGTWEQTTENTAAVTFTKSDDKNINDAFTFQLNGDTLTATSYDQGVYGENAPTFYRATGVVTGTVSYLQKIALPDNAVVEVYLVDATNENAPATYLSGVSFTTNGKQVPLEFAVPYAGSQIQASNKYFVQAFISADGKLLFKNSNGVAVLTNGAPMSGVEIIVEPPAQ
jgi:putative lipoprotein